MFENFDKYKIRWRFDFASRPARYGMWSLPAQNTDDMAAYQNKEGLVRASIEMQDVVTQEVITAIECDGFDYLNFQWIAARFGMYQGWDKIVGLKLITRTTNYNVFCTGEINTSPRTLDINFATFGK